MFQYDEPGTIICACREQMVHGVEGVDRPTPPGHDAAAPTLRFSIQSLAMFTMPTRSINALTLPNVGEVGAPITTPSATRISR